GAIMPTSIGQLPYYPVEFTKEGSPYKPDQVQALLGALSGTTTDLILASHGWNNDIQEAQALYDELFGNLDGVLRTSRSPVAGSLIVAGLFWPSKKFDDADLIPGGGAAQEDVGAVVERGIDRLMELLDPPEQRKGGGSPAGGDDRLGA